MLLSGVDAKIMLTNDKGNIVSKNWSNIQEYISSVGNAFNNLQKVKYSAENLLFHANLLKTIKMNILPAFNNHENERLSSYIIAAYELANFTHTTLRLHQIPQ